MDDLSDLFAKSFTQNLLQVVGNLQERIFLRSVIGGNGFLKNFSRQN
jgi:hypothetical protein